MGRKGGVPKHMKSLWVLRSWALRGKLEIALGCFSRGRASWYRVVCVRVRVSGWRGGAAKHMKFLWVSKGWALRGNLEIAGGCFSRVRAVWYGCGCVRVRVRVCARGCCRACFYARSAARGKQAIFRQFSFAVALSLGERWRKSVRPRGRAQNAKKFAPRFARSVGLE